MNVVFIVPTGIGAEIGGHAGDANPAAKLIAAACEIYNHFIAQFTTSGLIKRLL